MNNLHVVCPEYMPNTQWSETEILGAMTWLWHYDEKRKMAELWQVMGYVLPPIKQKQFAIFYEKEQPIGYITWANFSFESEQQYLNSQDILPIDYWNSGNRKWIVDFFAPMGHTRAIVNILKSKIFPTTIARGLSRRRQKSENIKTYIFKGIAVDEYELDYWKKSSVS